MGIEKLILKCRWKCKGYIYLPIEKQSWKYIHFHTEKLHVMECFTTIKMKNLLLQAAGGFSQVQCGIKKARDIMQ